MMKLDSNSPAFRIYLDAAQSVFFTRQLEEIDATMYETKYADLEAFQLVPTRKLGAGVEIYTYRQWDGRGVAKMTSNYATGSPRADVAASESQSKVRSIRNSYGYNIQEIRASMETTPPTPLESMRASVARRAINEKVNRVALLGDAEHGIVGLFNQPNAQTYTVPNGALSSPLWANKTGLEILNDMFGIVDQIPTVTKEIEKPTRLLLPYPRLRLIQRLPVSATFPNVSVLKYFQENRPSIEVRGALFLDTAGAGATARMVAYDPKPENLELLLPIPFESFPPQLQGMEYVIENHARMGGVVARFPLTLCYGDGI